jgi:hydrocephalus-inducing protein
MSLKAGEAQDLTIWAYPKTLGTFDDSLVCLIRDNPDPMIVPLSITGSKPLVEVDKLALDFGRLLLRTKDTQTLAVINKSGLPLQWKLTGVEGLTDFVIAPLGGTLEPYQICNVQASFEAAQPVVHKKQIKVEVMGIF